MKSVVKHQDKKINELATRDQIRALENSDKQLQAQMELELE